MSGKFHLISDRELVAMYGICETCGAPRNAAEMNLEDGTTMLSLVCSYHPLEHPA